MPIGFWPGFGAGHRRGVMHPHLAGYANCGDPPARIVVRLADRLVTAEVDAGRLDAALEVYQEVAQLDSAVTLAAMAESSVIRRVPTTW
ncbi:hypothetical protein K6T84_02275 [Mycolicibacter sp. MYC101]|nr:hypothetical protein [Mycolicibacter sp. MYC101]